MVYININKKINYYIYIKNLKLIYVYQELSSFMLLVATLTLSSCIRPILYFPSITNITLIPTISCFTLMFNAFISC